MPYLKALCVLVSLAALVLATPIPGGAQGWYMLTPPVVRGMRVVDEAAPLQEWRPSRLYESARECEETRSNWVTAVNRFEGSLRRARAVGTRCIASTDPRLTPPTPPSREQTGWYLLMLPQRKDPRPPPSEPGGSLSSAERVDPPVPLAHWSHRGSFDTEAECETARQPRGNGAQTDRPLAQCISVSDRRLLHLTQRPDQPAER